MTLNSTLVIFVMFVGVFALAIVVPEPKPVEAPVPPFITHYRSYTNNTILNHNVLSVSRKLIAATKTASCLSTYLRGFMNESLKGVSILLIDTRPGIGKIYLSAIENQNKRPIFLLNTSREDLENVTYQKTTSEALIIARDHDALSKPNVSFINLCGKGCSYAVVLTEVYDKLEKFTTEVKQVVSTMWKKKLANIVILGTVGTRFYATKSVKFKYGKIRQPLNPTHLKYCGNSKDWNSAEMFPKLDLNNSTFYISYFEKMPYVALDENKEFIGLEIGVLRIARDVLHMQISGQKIVRFDNTTVEEEVKEEFKRNGYVDIVFGGILWDPEGALDFTLPYDVAQIVWVVPKVSNISLQGLVSPLGDRVWMAVASVLLFGIFLRFTIFRSTTFLEIFALILSTGWYKQPHRHSVRLYFISWVLFGFLLAQFYLASMAGQLMAHADIQMNTMAELVESGFQLGGTITHESMFKEVDDGVDDTNVINQISKKFIVFSEDEYEKQWDDLISGVNQSVALVRTLNSSALGKSYSQNYVHTMSEVVASYPLAFAVWQGLPYLSQLDRVIQILVQGGIVDYLGRRFGDSKAAFIKESSSDNLELDDLVPAFLILVMGYLASGLCFLAELVTAWLKNRKKKTSQIQKKVSNRKKIPIERIKKKKVAKKTHKRVVVQTLKPILKKPTNSNSQMHNKALLLKDF